MLKGIAASHWRAARPPRKDWRTWKVIACRGRESKWGVIRGCARVYVTEGRWLLPGR